MSVENKKENLMGVQSIIHGRIAIKENYEECITQIHKLKHDENYPFLRTEMFSTGSNLKPYYYDEPIISFAASYKGVEDDWSSLILKFENLLEKLNFETAKLQLETEFYGTFNFFWLSKSNQKGETISENLFHEADKWFFGFGLRGRWGILEEKLDEEKYRKMGFKYPIELNAEIYEKIETLIDSLSKNEKYFLNSKIKISDELYPILTQFKLKNRIEFGFENEKGLWILKRNTDT